MVVPYIYLAALQYSPPWSSCGACTNLCIIVISFGSLKDYLFFFSAIAHRDIKSSNVLVKNRRSCCISDFGFALIHDLHGGIDMVPKRMRGTTRYLAPELLSETLNPLSFTQYLAADVYCLALTFWEIINTCPVGGKWYIWLQCITSGKVYP